MVVHLGKFQHENRQTWVAGCRGASPIMSYDDKIHFRDNRANVCCLSRLTYWSISNNWNMAQHRNMEIYFTVTWIIARLFPSNSLWIEGFKRTKHQLVMFERQWNLYAQIFMFNIDNVAAIQVTIDKVHRKLFCERALLTC